MSEYDLFLSYNSQDHALVTALAKELEARHTKVFLDRWHLIPGQPWPQRLRNVLASCKAVAVCVGPHEMGPWQQREMYFALERQVREPDFPVIPVLLPDANPPLDFLSQNTWVDIRGGLDNPMALAILQAAIHGETLDPAQAERVKELIRDICPYRGLQYFREQDATFFFGREQAVNELRAKLDQYPFVALVGASGAGKSSVVRAGLLPGLRKDTEHPWEIVTIVPGDRPLHNLAAALMPLLQPELAENDLMIEIGKQAGALLDGSLQVRDVIERILYKQPGTEHCLLVVDQWEELYTLAKKTDDQTGQNADKNSVQAKPNPSKLFIDGLLDACQAGKLRVVLTLRADFMAHVISYRRLSDNLKDAQVNLSAMKTEELQQAIEQPALKLDTGFESGLIELLLTDVGDEPGNLPLLEFVLKRLWHDPQRADQLRLQAYKAMGRLQGALQQEADTLYQALPSEHDRQQLRSLFLQLVTINEDNAYSRRRAFRDNLKPYSELIDRLTAARLLVSNRDEYSGRSTLEVAHEKLIPSWPILEEWLGKNREFLVWRKGLINALKDFDKLPAPENLLHGQHLQDARRWLKQKAQELNPQEIHFIRQSQRQLWLSNARIGLIVLLPLTAVSVFFGWASLNDLKPGLAVDVLRAKYLHSVSEPDMVTIPPQQGCSVAKPCEFWMGSQASDSPEDEQPAHRVHFTKQFKIGRYEVTFDEYQVFVYMINQGGGCQVPNQNGKRKSTPIKLNDVGWGKGRQPAINVSWNDAQCYVEWLNRMIKPKNKYRLPSESEWEFAIRAGTQTDFFWEGDKEWAKAHAWFSENSGNKTQPVGASGHNNNYGLYDMAGNVWEWTQDCWHDNYQNAPADGKEWLEHDVGNCSLRVLRGGSWDSGGVVRLRSAFRMMGDANVGTLYIGFRLAQD